MRFAAIVFFLLLSGCGLGSISEQIKAQSKAVHIQECTRVTIETPTDGGGKQVEETKRCKQWKDPNGATGRNAR